MNKSVPLAAVLSVSIIAGMAILSSFGIAQELTPATADFVVTQGTTLNSGTVEFVVNGN